MKFRTALLLLSLTVPAYAAKSDVAAPPTISFTKYRLDNGLEVILAPDRSLPIVAVNLWYHVGAANEEPSRTGFAHLFEHMMFTGTKHIRRGLADELLSAAGVSDSNATTSFDRTNYFDTVPSNRLELALWTRPPRHRWCRCNSLRSSVARRFLRARSARRRSRPNNVLPLLIRSSWSGSMLRG